MNTGLLQTIGIIIAALLGGGMIKAILDYINNRRRGKLEEHQFEYQTLSEMNANLRNEVRQLREDIEAERRRMRQEIDEEREKRLQLQQQLAEERSERRRLERRVEELEGDKGNSTSFGG